MRGAEGLGDSASVCDTATGHFKLALEPRGPEGKTPLRISVLAGTAPVPASSEGADVGRCRVRACRHSIVLQPRIEEDFHLQVLLSSNQKCVFKAVAAPGGDPSDGAGRSTPRTFWEAVSI